MGPTRQDNIPLQQTENFVDVPPIPRLRIAVWHNLNSGGGKRALYYHVKGLVERGHYVEAWCPPVADQDYLPLRDIIAEHIVPLSVKPQKPENSLEKLVHPYRDITERLEAMDRHCQECATEINNGNFDILFANSCTSFRVSKIGQYVNMAKVLYLQEPYRHLYEASPQLPWLALPPAGKDWWKSKKLIPFIANLIQVQGLRVQAREEVARAKAYDAVLCNSYFSRESILRAYGVDARVCYLGVDMSIFRNKHRPREDFVLGVGAFWAGKNIGFVIQALALIPEPRPRLVWVGDNTYGSYLDEVKQLAMSLGVEFESKVRIGDDELVELMNRARMLVYAPRLEPFGLVTLECNACGAPAVVTAEGGVRETVLNGVNGLVVDPDPSAMAQAISLLLHDRAYSHSLGKAGAEIVQQMWTLDAAVDRLERRFGEVLAGRPGEAPAKAVEHVQASPRRLASRLIAFYEPTFYAGSDVGSPDDEVTNWRRLLHNPARASKPLSVPRPAELGLYDLRSASTRQDQIDLARRHGVYGFCYYYYWRDGRPCYSQPVEEILAAHTPDYPFCLCLKNGSATCYRDGQGEAISFGQECAPGYDQAHTEWMLHAFKDPRYITVNGKPLFLVFRVDRLADAALQVEEWRAAAARAGLPGVYLCMVASLPLLNFDPAIVGFDAVVEFPPTGMTPQVLKRALNGHRSRLHLPIRLRDFQLLAGRSRTECTDAAYDYPTYVDVMTHQRQPDYTYFPGVFPSWDDSTTHATGACMFQNSAPNWYGRWLHHAITMARLRLTGDEQLVFINSWNDWAVLSQLEPDQRWDRQYLQMTQGVLASFTDSHGGS